MIWKPSILISSSGYNIGNVLNLEESVGMTYYVGACLSHTSADHDNTISQKTCSISVRQPFIPESNRPCQIPILYMQYKFCFNVFKCK